MRLSLAPGSALASCVGQEALDIAAVAAAVAWPPQGDRVALAAGVTREALAEWLKGDVASSGCQWFANRYLVDVRVSLGLPWRTRFRVARHLNDWRLVIRLIGLLGRALPLL